MAPRFVLALLATTGLVPAAALAQTLPSGGQVAAGAATIAYTRPDQLNITQTSDRAIINWQDFSVAQGARVDISQPGNGSALLNRVTSATPSTIAGQINANGQVYLINPNGIMITQTGKVSAAGFVASSLDMSDDDFMAGTITVTGRGGSVVNRGEISVVRGGYAALIGGKVENSGLILAPLGRVALGAGTRATLDLEGDGFLQVALPAEGGGIAMSGRIVADGGAVVLSAAQAREAARSVVNLSGSIEARGIDTRGGTVTLSGGDIRLDGASIDVSGTRGGGTVRIGGDRQGLGALAHADMLTVDAASSIRADATGTGDGGQVTLWSDSLTHFAGTISATGAGGGRGGDAEVSGKAKLDYAGITDLRGATFGTLLLDPYDVTISAGADANQSGFTATGNNSVINVDTLGYALALANVIVSTGTAGTQNGDITVAAPLVWNSGANLTLSAAGAVTINGAIMAQAGGLTISSSTNTAVKSTATAAINVARFTLAQGTWQQIGATLPGFETGDFRINGNIFQRFSGGTGSLADPYLVDDLYGLQGIGGGLSSGYRLTRDIDAANTAYWNGGAGFVPIASGSQFTGSIDGANHIVSGLTIVSAATSNVGFVAATTGAGIVQDIAFVAGHVEGANATFVGGLVGNSQGRILRASFSGDVLGASLVGGLAGGSIDMRRSFSSGTVTATNGPAGGLAGVTALVLEQSHSDAAVSASGGTPGSLTAASAGGLVGVLSGTIWDSYASGPVTSTDRAGGLVGFVSGGPIATSYATGRVSAPTAGGISGGGGGLTYAFFDTQTTGQAYSTGGGTNVNGGLTTAQARDPASYIGFDFDTVWFQSGDMRPILQGEAAIAGADGYIPITNLHQLQLITVDPGANYRLMRDIDASATAGTNPGGIYGATGFAPITQLRPDPVTHVMTYATPFNGILDGAGHIISGLTITSDAVDRVGLVAAIGIRGAIQDLTVIGGNVQAPGSLAVGGLAGLSQGLILRSSFSGDVVGASYAGGVAGFSSGVVSQSFSSGTVSATNGIAGGLIGYVNGSAFVSVQSGVYNDDDQNHSDAAVSASGGTPGSTSVSTIGAAGGLIGIMLGGTIRDSYATGSATSTIQAGGLVGYWGGGGTSKSYATARVSAPLAGGVFGTNYSSFSTSTVFFDAQETGQTIGTGTGLAAGTALTAAQARTAGAYGGLDFSSIWYQTGDMRPILRSEAAFAGADGYIPVSNLHQLALINADPTANYRLARDIDAGASAGFATNGIFSTSGFVPIGTSATPFTGTLDGDGHIISGLTINRPTTNGVGLIGYATGAHLTDISLTGVSITGNGMVGGLAGQINGSAALVDRAHVTGSITGQGAAVGGLVGMLSAGLVTTSITGGSVSGDNRTGGLVGRISTGTVSQSISSAAVSSRINAGGLVGGNDAGTVTQSYATGNVSATQGNAGGLVGNVAGTVSQSYSTGSVTAPTGAGGSMGTVMPSANVYSLFWDTTTSGTTTGIGISNLPSATATGLTSAQMNDVMSFDSFDFYTVWAPPSVARFSSDNQAHAPELYALSNILAVQGAPSSSFYGDGATMLPIIVYTGLHDGNFVGTLGGFDNVVAITPTTAVGRYDPNPLAASVVDPAHLYRIVYSSPVAVSPRQLRITANALTRIYGNLNPVFTYAMGGAGLINGDTLSGALGSSATTASNVGAYAITQGTLTAGSNYELIYFGADLTITPRGLTVTADHRSRAYGDANPALTYVFSGLVNGDLLTGALTTGANAASNVGSYAINRGTLAASSNYTLNFTSGTLTVAPRAVTVTADALARLYGDANPALTYAVGGSGLVNGDQFSGAIATSATTASNAGAYAITQGTLSLNGNYALTYAGANLTVTPRALTVTADSLNRIYGDANPAFTYVSSGLINGDLLTGALATGASAASNIGSYGINRGTLSAGGNYTLNFTDGTLTITPRTVTVTADALARLYGDSNPALTYTVGGLGLANGDQFSGALGSSATTASNVGAYAITQNTLSLNGNYALTFAGADLTVIPRALTVTADSLNRIYGDANPALTYALGGLGLVNGDTLSGALATGATPTSNVGAYGVTQGTLAASSNYALNFANGTLTIDPRSITIAADGASRVYGDADPAFTYSLGGSGLVNGDLLTGALGSSATTASGVGTYAVTQGTLTAGGNYALAYAGADLIITPPGPDGKCR